MTEETSGDVFRINITPAGSSFPWIKFYIHKFGIRQPGQEVAGVDAKRSMTREELALAIGNAIIDHSKVLSEWCAD